MTDTTAFGLCWAIKPSFIAYVSRMPDGKAYLGKGVGVNARNEMLFELDEFDVDEETEQAFAFRGEVLFSAHLGMLSVLISRPRIALRGGEGELTVADPESADGRRLRLVTFTVAGPATGDGVRCWVATDVRLTAEGVPLFGDVYQASEPFAPLMITIPDTGSSQ